MIHLEKPSSEYEERHLDLLREFENNWEDVIPMAMIIKEWENYEDLLTKVQDYREWKNMKPWYAPSSLFFIVDETDSLVGWIHIRHALAGTLSLHGWHIWYGIRPSERRKWYASEALKLALEEAKKLNISPVMLTCRKDNIGSAKTIMNNWWELECEYERDEEMQLKWWIKNN